MNISAGKMVLLVVAIICFALVPYAQSPNNKNAGNTKSEKTVNDSANEQRLRIDNLIALAQTAPPEVAGDLLLTLANSRLVPERERKIELVEQVFRSAGQVREPVRRRSWSAVVDTRAGLKQAAYDLKLDRLSMQSEAALQMIRLDPPRARTMFESIDFPSLKPLTCEDSLGYDPDSYYQAMLAVSEGCFSADERKANLHIGFLADRLENLKAVAQLTPAIKMIANAKLSGDELALPLSALIKSMGRLPADARSFAFATDRERFVYASQMLIRVMGQAGFPSGAFSTAVRSFLIKQVSDEVCADVSWLDKGKLVLPVFIADINREFTEPIVIDDLKPAKFGAGAKDILYWTTPRAKNLLIAAKHLRFGGGQTQLSREERQTDVWHREFVEYLDLIKDWTADSEASPEDYFQEKRILYQVLVDLCPDDARRDVVLRAYGDYLKETSREYKGRIEWILAVKDYLRVLRSKDETLRKSSLGPWQESSDSNLRIYAELALLNSTKN